MDFIKKHPKESLFYSYLAIVGLVYFFNFFVFPLTIHLSFTGFLSNFFNVTFSVGMFYTGVTIGVGACMLNQKDRAWGVRFLTVFCSLAALDIFIKIGDRMSTFFAAFSVPNSAFKTWLIIECILFMILLGFFIFVIVVTKPWEKYVLGFKSIDQIETELDLEQVNKEIKEFEK